ncbi:maltose permease MAL61 [Fusarium beomiforme]|uniref:Maltose permease MAL61 n=1 Tax=Fusarium beomiforme TaxID=44412 RepID=A0A9P5AK25_9HYPO|nr:maltose permease MAL61 [Fusarium beomiforme]
MSYTDRRKSDPQDGSIAPSYHELEMTQAWQTVPQQDEDITSYDPYISQVRRQDSASKQDPPPQQQEDEESQMPLRQALKKYPKIAGYCLAMTVPVIGWGYDLVIVGAVASVDTFKNDYGAKIDGEMDIPGNWLSLWLGLPPAGAALGGLLGGWLQNRLGRKLTLLFGTIFSVIAIACIFFSHMLEPLDTKRMMFTAGLTVQGFSVGVIKTTCVTWVSENTPTALRGSAMALFPVFTLLGQLIGLVVIKFINDIKGNSGYLGAFGSQWILSLGPLILSIVMPESPAHLIRTGQEQRAIKSATRLFAPRVSPYGALERIRATIEEEKANTASVNYWSCFKGTNLRRTLIVILASILPPIFGLELLSNASIFLTSLGMKSGYAIMFTLAGVIAGMLANGLGFWLLSRVGRRTLTLFSLTSSTVIWGAMGVTGFWKSETLTWATGGFMTAVIVVCGLGAWPAGYAILGETSSLQLRSLTQGLAGIAEKGFSIMLAVLLPMLFSRDKAALGGKTGFLFCGLCLIGTVLTWFFIPEMKGRSAIEIDHMFEMRLPARKFKSFKMEAHEVQEASPLASHTSL